MARRRTTNSHQQASKR